MQALPKKPERGAPISKSAKDSPESTEETLASLHANPTTGLLRADVEARRKDEGFNEVAEKRAHPLLMFVSKFWGSARACRDSPGRSSSWGARKDEKLADA